MGIIEILYTSKKIILKANIITYGNASTEYTTELIREEIETLWNGPSGKIYFNNEIFTLEFKITASYQPNLSPSDIFNSSNPANNFFRIEEFAKLHISSVDGVNSNTGYFKKDNLYRGSTTAAHEFGHSIGLLHPENLDIRGKGQPGIMYPRGTIVDSQYQWNPDAKAGESGGTLNPSHRKVLQEDIDNLKINKILENQNNIIGAYSSLYHDIQMA